MCIYIGKEGKGGEGGFTLGIAGVVGSVVDDGCAEDGVSQYETNVHRDPDPPAPPPPRAPFIAILRHWFCFLRKKRLRFAVECHFYGFSIAFVVVCWAVAFFLFLGGLACGDFFFFLFVRKPHLCDTKAGESWGFGVLKQEKGFVRKQDKIDWGRGR